MGSLDTHRWTCKPISTYTIDLKLMNSSTVTLKRTIDRNMKFKTPGRCILCTVSIGRLKSKTPSKCCTTDYEQSVKTFFDSSYITLGFLIARMLTSNTEADSISRPKSFDHYLKYVNTNRYNFWWSQIRKSGEKWFFSETVIFLQSL